METQLLPAAYCILLLLQCFSTGAGFTSQDNLQKQVGCTSWWDTPGGAAHLQTGRSLTKCSVWTSAARWHGGNVLGETQNTQLISLQVITDLHQSKHQTRGAYMVYSKQKVAGQHWYFLKTLAAVEVVEGEAVYVQTRVQQRTGNDLALQQQASTWQYICATMSYGA